MRIYDIITTFYIAEVKNMTPVSICIIAKNEEKNMDKFLSSIQKSMKNYPHEIVIVDTGSSDSTLKIIQKYNVKLFHFEWCNDFSAARNYSLQCASFQWVLVLDCDEFITHIDVSCFDKLSRNFPKSVGLITRNNHCWSGNNDRIYTDEVNRLFHKNSFHYEEIIHEQLVSNDGQPYQMLQVPITVDHVGYIGSSDELHAKALRNNQLLFKMLEKNPNDPYVYFQIGQSFNLIDDSENAYKYYKKGLEFDIDPSLEYVHLMILGYGEAMLELGKYQEALTLESVQDVFDVSPEFACLMGRIYRLNGQYINAMKEFLKATTYSTADLEGSNTYIPLYQMGYINELMGQTEEAKKLYQNCGNYPAALERLTLLLK